MKTKSFKFGEAVRALAIDAGMEIYKFTQFDKKKEERFLKYKNIYKSFEDYFHEQLFVNLNKDSSTIYLREKYLWMSLKNLKLGLSQRTIIFLKY